MANRYWVGGAGTWDLTNTANWSTTSGGAGGASVLTAQASAAAPIAGSPAPAIPLLPGAVEILSFGELAFFSGLSSTAATVYITPGSGV